MVPTILVILRLDACMERANTSGVRLAIGTRVSINPTLGKDGESTTSA